VATSAPRRSCPGRPAAERYRQAVGYVFAHQQQQQRRSHVHKVVLEAMRGDFGETAPHVWLSPLLSLDVRARSGIPI
jgi:hypothetical protein